MTASPNARRSAVVSTREATLAMLKATLGPGALALPYALSRAGLLALPAMVALQAACVYAMHLLVRTKHHLVRADAAKRHATYGDIGAAALGSAGRAAVEVAVVLQQLGICAVYFSFAASNAKTILASLTPSLHLSEVHLTLLTVPAIGMLAQFRDWKRLARLSAVANVLMLGGICIVFSFVLRRLIVRGVSAHVPASSLSGLPVLTGQVLYAFEGIANVLPIESSLRDPRGMTSALNASQLLYCVTMLLMAVLPVLAYGQITEGSIGDEIEKEHPGHGAENLLVGMNAAITVAVLLTYPVQLFPAVEVLEGWIMRARRACASRDEEVHLPPLRALSEPLTGPSDAAYAVRCADGGDGTATLEDVEPALRSRLAVLEWPAATFLRITLTALTASLSILVPNLGLMIALLGSFVAPMLTLMLPALFASRLLDLSCFELMVHVWLIMIALISSTVGTAVVAYHVASSAESSAASWFWFD